MVKALIKAARLRTLPLAICAIAMGGIVSAFLGTFQWSITLLAALTAILLQVLSNFANDYGDFTKGTDKNRSDRALGSGDLTAAQMLRAIVFLSVLSLASGIILLILSFHDQWLNGLIFLGIGILSIGAAVWYTTGKNAYGYRGYGDLAVLIFFGFVPVSGMYYLNNPHLGRDFNLSFLPAIAFGLLSTMVLNVNNIRDIENDKANNKITLAVRFGRKGALIYHSIILALAFLMIMIFMKITMNTWSITILLLLPLYLLHFVRLSNLANNEGNRELFNKLLKQQVFLNIFFTVIFGLLVLI